MLAEATQATMVIFDNELSPATSGRWRRSSAFPFWTGARLILDIFAQRAKTKEGRLQVELAQYNISAAAVRHGHEPFRQGGGIGTRGPGETKLNPTGGTSGERINKVWKRSWNRCARCAPSSGSGE